ncbi:MAG: type IV secretion system protein [Pseudomonadota bacterium]
MSQVTRFLFQSFLVITIVFAGATYAFGNTSVGIEYLLKKILLIGGALFLVTNWLDVTNVVISSFGVLGLRAGGVAAVQLTTAELFSPSRIAGIGVGFADQLLTLAGNEVGIFNGNNGAALLLLVAALVMGLSFIIIALQVFMTLIEFKLVTLGGFILLPFALLDRTTSLAQGVLGYVIAAGLKIFVLAIVISLAAAFVEPLILSEEVTSAEAFSVMALALTFVLLAIRAPGLAASIGGAGPQIGIGAIAQTAATVAAPAAAAGFATAAGAKATIASGRLAGAAGRLGGKMMTQGNVGAAELRRAGRAGSASSGSQTQSAASSIGNHGQSSGDAAPGTATKIRGELKSSGRHLGRAGAAAAVTTSVAGHGGGGGSPSVDISSKS